MNQLCCSFRFILHPSYFILMVSMLASTTLAQPKPISPDGIAKQPNQVRGDEITPRQQEAVEKGLRWLAAHQQNDGAFGGEGGANKHAGVTAMAALAFMQGGNLPGRGKYGDNVQKCLDFVLASA